MLKKSMMILVALGAFLGTGCGHGGETQVDIPEDDGYEAPAPTGPSYPGQPGYPAQPGYPGQPGMQPGTAPSLAALQQAWSQVRTLSANYDLWEKATSGTETANVKFYLKKPGQYRYEVSKHSTSLKNGSKSVFDTRTRKIQSKLAGLLGMATISGTLDDDRSKSVRKYTLDQTDYVTQTELLLKPGAQVTQRGPNVLELARPAKYPGVEAMRVTLDARNLPSAFELVAGGQVVYRKRITGVQVNPTISADKFQL